MLYKYQPIYLILFFTFLFLQNNAAELGCNSIYDSEIIETVVATDETGIIEKLTDVIPKLNLINASITYGSFIFGIFIGDYIDNKCKRIKLIPAMHSLQKTTTATNKIFENRAEQESKHVASDIEYFFENELPEVDRNSDIEKIIAGYLHNPEFYPEWKEIKEGLSENLTRQQESLSRLQQEENRINKHLTNTLKDIKDNIDWGVILPWLVPAAISLSPYAGPLAPSSSEILSCMSCGCCAGISCHFLISKLVEKCRRN